MRDRRCMSRLALFAVAAAACGTTITVSQINTPPSGARRHAGDDVEVLSGSAPARAHVDVAILVAHRGQDTFEQALAQLKIDAGAIGCDAIAIDKVARSAAFIEPEELTVTCVMYKT